MPPAPSLACHAGPGQNGETPDGHDEDTAPKLPAGGGFSVHVPLFLLPGLPVLKLLDALVLRVVSSFQQMTLRCMKAPSAPPVTPSWGRLSAVAVAAAGTW